jgi:hypothetical protein
MTTDASVRNEESTLEAGRLGAGFIRWGTGLFIFGLIIGYGPLDAPLAFTAVTRPVHPVPRSCITCTARSRETSAPPSLRT